jgi:hypothetical protein
VKGGNADGLPVSAEAQQRGTVGYLVGEVVRGRPADSREHGDGEEREAETFLQGPRGAGGASNAGRGQGAWERRRVIEPIAMVDNAWCLYRWTLTLPTAAATVAWTLTLPTAAATVAPMQALIAADRVRGFGR